MCTENISRSGLLIVWQSDNGSIPLPSVGQIVTVEVELPANHGFGQKCIHCQGTVTRVAEGYGIGARHLALPPPDRFLLRQSLPSLSCWHG